MHTAMMGTPGASDVDCDLVKAWPWSLSPWDLHIRRYLGICCSSSERVVHSSRSIRVPARVHTTVHFKDELVGLQMEVPSALETFSSLIRVNHKFVAGYGLAFAWLPDCVLTAGHLCITTHTREADADTQARRRRRREEDRVACFQMRGRRRRRRAVL